MNSPTPHITEQYYVVFTASSLDNWMIRWLKAPFQHVYAVKQSEGGFFWIKIDPTCSATLVSMYPVSEYPHIRCLTGADAVVLPVECVIKNKERWTLCVINCVEIVKSLLGIRSFWTFTPWQLYKYLINKDNKNGQQDSSG